MKNKIRDYIAIVMNFNLNNSAHSQTNRKRVAAKPRKRQKAESGFALPRVFVILFTVTVIIGYCILKTDMNKQSEKDQNTFRNTQRECLYLKTKLQELSMASSNRDSFCIDLQNECEQLRQQNEILYKSVKEISMNSSGVIFKNCGAGIVTGGEVNVTMNKSLK
jgi:hypothetical protein